MTSDQRDNPELNQAVRDFLSLPAAAREPHRLGKGKLHHVYRLKHADTSYVIKVRGRDGLRVQLRNWWKGIRHYAVTGEITRMRLSSVTDRWKNEVMTAVGWMQLGLPTIVFVPFPDEDVRVQFDVGFGTLAEHLRDPAHDRKFKLYSLMEVAGIMFARHTIIAASGNPHLFHEEPHSANLLYRPGELIYVDQEFLPDETKPDMHHAACELIALTQSVIRDLDYEDPEEVVAAIAHGYPDPQTLETVSRLLDVRRPRWRWPYSARAPVNTEELAVMFREHTTPEARMRPGSRPVPLGMPGDLQERPGSNPLG